MAEDADGGFAGFVLVRFVEEETAEGPTPVCYVYEAHVAAGRRGEGLGSRLMAAAERAATAAGMRCAMLTVFMDNQGARRFYRRVLGYERDASSPQNYADMKIAKRADGKDTGDHAYEILSKPLEPTREQAAAIAEAARAIASAPQRASTRRR